MSPAQTTQDRPTARNAATSLARRLRDAGHEAYFAGGCVRDELLGHTPQDYDVATDATPERVGDLFRRTRGVGKSFGVVLVHTQGHTIEVATFRAEGPYTDKRRPDEVRYADARADAHRRDFTINALFRDPLDTGEDARGRVIDFVGGRDDLRAGVVRAVGVADERLAEDHLRALRGVRFAARLGFRLDDATAHAITRHARELEGVSRERVGDEIRRMLDAPTRAQACDLMQELGLDGPALGEDGMPGVTLRLTRALGPEVGLAPALAAWALDRATGEGDDPALDAGEAADQVIGRWRRSLCLANDERDAVRGALLGFRALRLDWREWGVAKRKRAASSEWFADALALVRAWGADLATGLEHERDALAGDGIGLAPTPLVTGDDLIRDGFEAGPRFAGCLDRVYDAQLEGRVATRREGLDLARSILE